MKRIPALLMLLMMVLGCGAQPKPGYGTAEVSVVAKPRSGADHGFVHVPVYDAAPAHLPPTGVYEHVDYSRLSDIIVWLQPQNPASQKPGPMVLELDPDKPSKDVLSASVGQPIRVHNRSAKAISVYSVSDGNDFEFPPIPPDMSNKFAPKSEGLIEILADPAKPPIAQVYAAPSPWVSRTRAGKTVTFRDVPPGNYTVVTWHPRLPGSSSPITLSGGEVSRVTVMVGVNAMARNSSP